jgi:hypothetical protein
MAIQFVDPTVELELFVEWVLTDLTERKASGKRPKQAMIGFWMTRPNLPGRSRLSDLTERRYVAISAVLNAGATMDVALALVCRQLGREDAEDREKIRIAYYDFKNSRRAVSMDIWRGCFYSWAEWVLTVDPRVLNQVSADYISLGKQNKAIWFSDFEQRLRNAATVTRGRRVLETAPAIAIPPSQ